MTEECAWCHAAPFPHPDCETRAYWLDVEDSEMDA